jgi:hypothetical protein
MVINSSVDALRELLILTEDKEKIKYNATCRITNLLQKISYTKDGIEYYFVEVTCRDDSQYGIQAFGDEAIALYIEANRWMELVDKRCHLKNEKISGIHSLF